MSINNEDIGRQIARLRGSAKLTQSELGDRLGITFQAVSKWERGETLPDVSLLPDLADILGTTVDNILRGTEHPIVFRGKIRVADMAEGIRCLERMGELLGKDNIIYRYATEGIDRRMNTDIATAFEDDRIFEAFVAEAVIQNLRAGFYVDITDIKRSFKHGHLRELVLDCAAKCGIV